jgi:hypothetical protein
VTVLPDYPVLDAIVAEPSGRTILGGMNWSPAVRSLMSIRSTNAFAATRLSGYHHDREIGEPLLDLCQQLQAVHTRHVDVRQHSDERRPDFPGESIQRLHTRSGKVDHIGSLAGLAAKALAKQVGDIGSSSTTRMLARRADCPPGKLTLMPLPFPSSACAAIEP